MKLEVEAITSDFVGHDILAFFVKIWLLFRGQTLIRADQTKRGSGEGFGETKIFIIIATSKGEAGIEIAIV